MDSMAYLQIFQDKAELLEPFTREEKGELLEAMLSYAFSGVEPVVESNARYVWPVFRQMIDASRTAYQQRTNAGKKGGRPSRKPDETEPKAEETEMKAEETGENRDESENNRGKPLYKNQESRIKNQDTRDKNQEIRDKNQDIRDIGDIPPPGASAPADPPHKKPIRHQYGQYKNVLLSDADLGTLKEEFPADWAEWIERLSEYIASKGAKYKNHLATIRAWARKDQPVQKKLKYENAGTFV